LVIIVISYAISPKQQGVRYVNARSSFHHRQHTAGGVGFSISNDALGELDVVD